MRERGREGGREGAREGGREGGRERGRERGREGAREGGREEQRTNARREPFIFYHLILLPVPIFLCIMSFIAYIFADSESKNIQNSACKLES